MATFTIPIVFSSSSDSGANNKSDDGSSFSVDLQTAIKVPSDAHYCWVEVQSAQVWNTVPNITTGTNDKFYFSYSGIDYNFTLEQGLYDLDALSYAISRNLLLLGLTSDIITLTGDQATSKCVFTFKDSTVQLDFTKSQTFRDILGFNSRIVSGSSQLIIKGDNVAGFNLINYFLIHCDLVNYGLGYNDRFSQIVSEVYIDAPVGSQILSRPYNVPKIPANELIGVSRNSIQIWLTDENNNRVNTNGEDFSFRMTINYVL